MHHCRPGQPGYPSKGDSAARPVAITDSMAAPPTRTAPPRAAPPAQAQVAATAKAARLRLQALRREHDETVAAATDASGSSTRAPTGHLEQDVLQTGGDQLGCAPFMRTIGTGERAVSICPIMNGIWTAFHNRAKWPEYPSPLSAQQADGVVADMDVYDSYGLRTWIGEDFDERVLSALQAHHAARSARAGTDASEASAFAPATPPTNGSSLLAYSIIVEQGQDLVANLDTLQRRLGTDALRWVQLGPPALEADNLATYQAALASGQVDWFGVEDYTLPMLQRFARDLPISTVRPPPPPPRNGAVGDGAISDGAVGDRMVSDGASGLSAMRECRSKTARYTQSRSHECPPQSVFACCWLLAQPLLCRLLLAACTTGTAGD